MISQGNMVGNTNSQDRKISSQGLMQPAYASLEQYNTIEENLASVDHFPAPT